MSSFIKSKFENWIFYSFRVSREGLGLYRIFTALFILFFMLPSPRLYAFLSGLPPQFFTPPPGPMSLFSSFPHPLFFSLLHYLLILALIFLCVGFETKASSLAVGTLLLILKGFIYSVGKINHELLLIVVPLVMAFSGWGGAYSVDAWRRSKKKVLPQSWPITLLALILGFMMFTAGFPKILGGWLNIHSQAAYGHYLREYILRGRTDLLAPYGQHLGVIFWELMDYATVLFEVSFLIAIITPQSTRIYVCLAVMFHFGTMLFLNITFLPNFLVYAAFLNWSRINEAITSQTSKVACSATGRSWAAPIAIGIVLSAIWVVSGLFNGYNLLRQDWGITGILFVGCSVPIALTVLGRRLYMRFIT